MQAGTREFLLDWLIPLDWNKPDHLHSPLLLLSKMSWLLKKIVHNEAMKEDPKEIYGWRVLMLAGSVSLFSAMAVIMMLDLQS